MEIFIGGTAQGKLTYVLKKSGLTQADAGEGETLALDPPGNLRVLNHFERFVRRLLCAGIDPYEAVQKLADRNPDLLLISDEIGSGVVPIDAGERRWRETTGRLLCILAERATTVTAVTFRVIKEFPKKNLTVFSVSVRSML